MTDNKPLIAARRERARRWASALDMRGYPAVPDEEETEMPLAATLPKRTDRNTKTALDARS